MMSRKVIDMDFHVWKFAVPRSLSICGIPIDFVPVVVSAIVAPLPAISLARGGGFRSRAAVSGLER